MFRVHFTAADIARTRIAPPPGPLAEAVFSLDALQRPGHDPVLEGWREQMGTRVRSGRSSRLLADLLPRGWAVEPTTPGVRDPARTLDEVLDRFHGVAVVDAPTPAGEVDEVVAALRRWFRVAVAPYWTGIRALLESERRRLARLAGERGVDALLATLHPSIRWQPPVLHIQAGTDHDWCLDGRGLAIVPSLFCPAGYPVCRDRDRDRDRDVAVAREAAPLRLYYPAVADPFVARTVWSTGTRATDASLVALLGRTRARVLQALGEGDGACSTTDLAARAGVAVSSASEHATVLRQAGLVDSRRDRSTVFHWLTGLGVGLLDGHRRPRR